MELNCAGLLLIRDRKLLLAYSRHKQCFYLPGGKLDAGETAVKALCREISEELNVDIREENLSYYMHVTAAAYGESAGTIMEQDCFFYHYDAAPTASSEIGELKYFSLDEYLGELNQAPGAIMILQKLQADGYVD